MRDRTRTYLPPSLQNNTEKTAFLLLAGCVSLSLVSIAISQILLFGTLVVSSRLLSSDRKSFSSIKGILLPLVIFFFWTLLAALMAPNVPLALTGIKKFYLFLLIPLVPLIVRGRNRSPWIYKAIFSFALFSSLVGIGQFFLSTQASQTLYSVFNFISRWWFFLPLMILCAWNLASFILTLNTNVVHTIPQKRYLALLFPKAHLIVHGQNRFLRIYTVIFSTALFSSLVGISLHYTKIQEYDLLHRISGLVSHWMTYSGLLMLALVLLIAYGIRTSWKRFFIWTPVAALIALAIILSQTRNAALGVYAGVFVILILAAFWEKQKRFVLFIFGLILFSVFLYFAAPASIQQRFRSGLDPDDDNTRNRIELIKTSVRMIQDNPWFGVGPKNVKYEALKYRGRNEFPDWMYLHMHNNALQIAAATGIPGLIIWLWLVLRLAWDSLRTYRFARSDIFPYGEEGRREATIIASAALASWTALMIAGMFEYNFGDSEVLTLFLFIMSAPYAYSPDFFKAAGASGHERRRFENPESRRMNDRRGTH